MHNNSKFEIEKFIKEFPADIWLTVTFRKTVNTGVAIRRFKYFLKHLNKPDQQFYKKYINVLVVCEKNRYRQGVHIHALVKGMDISLAPALESACNERFGESKAKAPHEGVAGYLADKFDSSSL